MVHRGISKNWRVVFATLFSLILVIGTYEFAHTIDTPQVAQASSETALLQAIATKDSSGDGIPDWEKALYNIPINATTTDYFNLGMTDGEAVARGLIVPRANATIPTATSTRSSASSFGNPTITSSFAQSFFSQYLAAKQKNGGADLSATQVDTLAGQVLQQLSQSTILNADMKTGGDIKVVGSGDDAMRTFAVAAETVFAANQGAPTLDEMAALTSAVESGDINANQELVDSAKIYRNYAKGLLALPVPQTLAGDDLTLINAMILRADVDTDLANVNTDPLAALTALQQFSNTESVFWTSFSNIANTYAAAGITFAPSEPGANFVNLIANSSQKSGI